MNLAAVVERHAAAATALLAAGQAISYGDLRRRVAGVRGALGDAGVGPGDRVAVIAENGPAFVVGLLGILGVGGAAVPLNPQAPPAELGRELEAVGASGVILGPDVALPPEVLPPTVLAADPTGRPEAVALAAAEDGDPGPWSSGSPTTSPSSCSPRARPACPGRRC